MWRATRGSLLLGRCGTLGALLELSWAFPGAFLGVLGELSWSPSDYASTTEHTSTADQRGKPARQTTAADKHSRPHEHGRPVEHGKHPTSHEKRQSRRAPPQTAQCAPITAQDGQTKRFKAIQGKTRQALARHAETASRSAQDGFNTPLQCPRKGQHLKQAEGFDV